MEIIINKTYDFSARDPFVTKHNGMYYRCFTKDTESVSISRGKTIEELKTAEAKVIYTPEPGSEFSKELWAPELHIIDGKCYIYVACDDGNNDNHRMCVLGNDSSNPMEPYTLLGKICDTTDRWAIDGTVMKYKGELYFIWAGWEGYENVCQNLYIAKMKSPTELCTERFMISSPELDWELVHREWEVNSPLINEGPFAFTMDGKTYVSYSASSSMCEGYCIALLELTGDNPLNKNNWKKHAKPVQLLPDNVAKGGGHASIICEEDATHIFFHGWDYDEKDIDWNTVCTWHGVLEKAENGFVIR